MACRGGLNLPPELAAVSRRALSYARRSLAASGARPAHLEAPESYCSEAQYYLPPHSPCFDALRAYYAHDMRLFQLPSCPLETPEAGAAGGATSAAAAA